MLFKLSIKNIKKSVKDYSIYFFTLVFAVAMFYMFNSIDAQSSMLVLNDSKYQTIKVLVSLISYVSVFVSIILGFLIVYSNNFLIRRRKKEIGLYYTLGMSKRKVSRILVIETLLIGIFSLAIGLIGGIGLSQFLSILVSKLFEVDMSGFKFIFSVVAFRKTLLYFGIIFLLVIVFNVITLSRFKLIDLLNAERKNEQVKIRNKYVTIIAFVLSILFLGYAYYLLIFENVLLTMDYRIGVMIGTGSIGTFLLFFSLSGFLLKVFQRTKKLYYKDLNLFTLKQVNSKINTTVVSTTVICLMLLLTIGMLSGSMSLAKVFNTDFADNNLTDYTAKIFNSQIYVNDEQQAEVKEIDSFANVEKMIKQDKFLEYSKEFVLFHKYGDKNLKSKNLLTEKDITNLKKEYGSTISLDFNVPIVKESEYQQFVKMVGKSPIEIDEGKYLLMGNMDFIMNAEKAHYEAKTPIIVNGYSLTPATDSILKLAYENYTSAGNDGIVIVNDDVVNGLDLLHLSLVGNLNGNEEDEKYTDDFYRYMEEQTEFGFDFRTRSMMEASSLGLKTMVIFLGLYLGITFAISSATVLAIGQLSESSDNKKRYKILRQLGADNKMINKALFTQIAITFMFPLVIALIHAYFGLRELNGILVALGTVDLTSNILLTTLFMIVVYGGYFLLTYLFSKNIIKE